MSDETKPAPRQRAPGNTLAAAKARQANQIANAKLAIARARATEPLTAEELKKLRRGNMTLATPASRRLLVSRMLDLLMVGRLEWHKVNSAVALVDAAGRCRDHERERREIDDLMAFRVEVMRGRAQVAQSTEQVDLRAQMIAAAASAPPPAQVQ